MNKETNYYVLEKFTQTTYIVFKDENNQYFIIHQNKNYDLFYENYDNSRPRLLDNYSDAYDLFEMKQQEKNLTSFANCQFNSANSNTELLKQSLSVLEKNTNAIVKIIDLLSDSENKELFKPTNIPSIIIN